MKAVLDTNVVISAIFFGGEPLRIIKAAHGKRLDLVATRAVLDEYREVAERLHRTYPTVGYRRALAMLESIITLVHPATLKGQVCRDPDDDALIACALGARAKIICSGDDDLLSVNGYAGIKVLRPSEFCRRFLR